MMTHKIPQVKSVLATRWYKTPSRTAAEGQSLVFEVSKMCERVYLLFPQAITIFHPLSFKDQINRLLDVKQFIDAIHLCKKTENSDLLEFSANEYACYLWEVEGKHKQAIQVWAEYLLPAATKEYWNEFCYRLDMQEKLHLLEDYLPFDNRSLLDPNTYFRILNYHLKNGDYDIFHDRILRWPVVYPIKRVVDRINEELKGSPPCSDALLHSLFKLYDFQNEYILAFDVLAKIHPKEAFEYFTSNNLWVIFETLNPSASYHSTALWLVEDERKRAILRRLYGIDPEETKKMMLDAAGMDPDNLQMYINQSKATEIE